MRMVIACLLLFALPEFGATIDQITWTAPTTKSYDLGSNIIIGDVQNARAL